MSTIPPNAPNLHHPENEGSKKKKEGKLKGVLRRAKDEFQNMGPGISGLHSMPPSLGKQLSDVRPEPPSRKDEKGQHGSRRIDEKDSKTDIETESPSPKTGKRKKAVLMAKKFFGRHAKGAVNDTTAPEVKDNASAPTKQRNPRSAPPDIREGSNDRSSKSSSSSQTAGRAEEQSPDEFELIDEEPGISPLRESHEQSKGQLEILKCFLGSKPLRSFKFLEQFFCLKKALFEGCVDNGALLGPDRDAVLDILRHEGFYVLFPSPQYPLESLVNDPVKSCQIELIQRSPIDCMKALILMFSSFGIPYQRDHQAVGGYRQQEGVAISLEAWKKQEDVARNIKQLRHMIAQAEEMGWKDDRQFIYRAVCAIQQACHDQGLGVYELDQFVEEMRPR